jgi:hypothetical protein
LIAEYPRPYEPVLSKLAKERPDWDPASYRRSLEAVRAGQSKLVVGSDGRAELYDLAKDPGEAEDIAGKEPEEVKRLLSELQRFRATRRTPSTGTSRVLDEKEKARLRALGYLPEEDG